MVRRHALGSVRHTARDAGASTRDLGDRAAGAGMRAGALADPIDEPPARPGRRRAVAGHRVVDSRRRQFGRSGDGEQAVAVAAGPVGFAAVGYRESGSSREGLAWFSADGHTWTRIEAPETFAGIEMLDVTAAPNGFAALGMTTPAMLRSARTRPSSVRRTGRAGSAWMTCPAPTTRIPPG